MTSGKLHFDYAPIDLSNIMIRNIPIMKLISSDRAYVSDTPRAYVSDTPIVFLRDDNDERTEDYYCLHGKQWARACYFIDCFICLPLEKVKPVLSTGIEMLKTDGVFVAHHYIDLQEYTDSLLQNDKEHILTLQKISKLYAQHRLISVRQSQIFWGS